MLLLRDHFPIKTLCEVLDVPRSSVYYTPRPAEDRMLRDVLIESSGPMAEWLSPPVPKTAQT